MVTVEELTTFCKKKGLVFANSEIYGGIAGFFDYGPIGVELKNNIKKEWWTYHVQQRQDVVGIDGSIIAHPTVWIASGHVNGFSDVLVSCTKCNERFRADVLIEDLLNISASSLTLSDINEFIRTKNLKCTKCKSPLGEASAFNLMFQTFVGPKQDKDAIAYLRPETAQLMFANFKLVAETARCKLPFGIAQIGKAFRNEISPRNFLFRMREFEQMEIEYFIHPDKHDECPFIKHVLEYELLILSSESQIKGTSATKMTIAAALENNIIQSPWHAYWLATEHNWFVKLGCNPEHIRVRQHVTEEKAHYAKDTWDLEYEFPFGWKELQGIADRSDYDLQQHIKNSGKDLSLYDEETKKKIVPHVVAEPSTGVDRAFLLFLCEAYLYSKERDYVVLRLHPALAPVKAAIFPLLSNKEELTKLAHKIYEDIREDFPAQYDTSGSVGRRYARADEIGIPYCITIDFDSITNKDVTIRDRDTASQIRVPIKQLQQRLCQLLKQEIAFEKAGVLVKKENNTQHNSDDPTSNTQN